jgi:hypothetical protein
MQSSNPHQTRISAGFFVATCVYQRSNLHDTTPALYEVLLRFTRSDSEILSRMVDNKDEAIVDGAMGS